MSTLAEKRIFNNIPAFFGRGWEIKIKKENQALLMKPA
jgi:hypothetical protein